MRILITGAKGFVGKNLSENLKNIRDGKNRTRNISIEEIYEYDLDTEKSLLEEYCRKADFVFHLAGVNRPKHQEDFMQGNYGFSAVLLDTLKKYQNTCPVMLSSSIQATLVGRYAGSEYGKSKLAGEELFFRYGQETGAKVLVYRFPNLFGKWCRPNYNSVVATFCYNIANDLPIRINDRSTELELLYIDDLVEEMLNVLEGRVHLCACREAGTEGNPCVCQEAGTEENPCISPEAGTEGNPYLCQEPGTADMADGRYCCVPVTYKVTLGEIADSLYFFKKQPETLVIPSIAKHSFVKKLYSTYLSYLPVHRVKFPLLTKSDSRGSFTELIKTLDCGQMSINISKPGITKGEHWHNSKWELFIVVAGHALIQQRRVGSEEVMEFEVSGDKMEAVHMLPGYIHNIINLSESENLVTVMWANEQFDQNQPDTFSERVIL